MGFPREDNHPIHRQRKSEFNGYDKDYIPPKVKLKPTEFSVGDKVVVKGEDNEIYLKGTIVSLVKDMLIEGKIVKYSNSIRYPVGDEDVYTMDRDGTRNLNGEDFKTYKVEPEHKQYFKV